MFGNVDILLSAAKRTAEPDQLNSLVTWQGLYPWISVSSLSWNLKS